MFLQLIWFMMVVFSLVFSCIQGKTQEMFNAALAGVENAIALTIRLGAGYMFFGGLMEIARELQAARGLEKLIRPVMQKLMPAARSPEIREAVAMNLSMNLLGAGNAATPLGMEAVRLMDAAGESRGMRQDIAMFLILNATSIQLLPTTVLTLRASAGSADVNAVLLPTLLCTAVSTLTGVAAGLIVRRWEGRHG